MCWLVASLSRFKELGGKDTACQKSKSQDKQMTNQSENGGESSSH